MESTAVPRDHFRASILLVLAEVRAHGYDLPALREADGHMGTWLARYRALRRMGGPQACPGVSAAS